MDQPVLQGQLLVSHMVAVTESVMLTVEETEQNIIKGNMFTTFWKRLILTSTLGLLFTRRYGPLHGPTFSSCGGLRPLTKVFFALIL